MEPEQQVEQAPKQQPEKSWITEASLLVPLAIFIYYIWTLSQVVGFYHYFSVPANFISLNPTTVLSESRPYYILLAILLFYIYWVILLARFVDDPSVNYPNRGFYLSSALNGLLTLIFLYLNLRANDLLWYIISALFIIAMIGIFAFKVKLIDNYKLTQEKRHEILLSLVRYRNDFVIICILFAVGVVSPGLFYLGRYSGKEE